MRIQPKWLTLLAVSTASLGVHAQVFTYNFSGGAVPDDSPIGGLTLNGLVPDNAPLIGSLQVSLGISGVGESGAFLGDLFAFLRHETDGGDVGYVVLLNRPGTTAEEPFGYSDKGLNVTFDDSSTSAFDVHTYRRVVTGSDATALPFPGVLEGTWKTDGREADPNLVVDSDPRTATLDSFIGMESTGLWTLYVQDFSGGGVARVDFWSLVIRPQAIIPEPAHGVGILCLGLGGFALWRRRK